MKLSPVHQIVYTCAGLVLVACSTGGPKVDIGWIGESVSSPQNDTVINESGQSLPALAVQQSAPQATVAPQTATQAPGRWGFLSQMQQQPTAQATPPVQPATQPVAMPQNAARSYTVKQGDTLSSIAARHGVSTASLISLNGLAANPNALRIGQVLQVPAAGALPASSSYVPATVSSTASYRTYTVVAGDTLSGIAARNGTTVSAIMAVNGFTPDHANRIRVGQTIKLPRN